MRVTVGTDILDKKRFLQSLKNGGETFLHRVFTSQELRQNSNEQLASIFCIKESVMKALELPHDSWLEISTDRKDNGKVACTLLTETFAKDILSLDTSISHEAELIIGVAVVLLQS